MSNTAQAMPSRKATLKRDIFAEQRRASVQGDVERLVAALAARGIAASNEDVYAAWKRNSDSYEAGWLGLCDDAYNVRLILEYLDISE